MAGQWLKETNNTKFFKFRLESETDACVIPQSVNDGSNTFQVSANWTKQNLPGSTEPMVAFNYTDAPTINFNLKFHQDMWRDAGLDIKGYQEAVNKFVSLAYPGAQGQIIKPPYCIVYDSGAVYRGYFTSIRVTQSGPIRDGLKVICEINSSFTVIRKYAVVQSTLASNGYKVYFSNAK